MTYIATQDVMPDGIEVRGDILMSLQSNLNSDQTDRIFAKYHLAMSDIESDGWYPGAILFEIYQEIGRQPGGSSTFVAMGKATTPLFTQILGVTTPEEYFNVMPQASVTGVRNMPEGFGYIASKIDDRHYEVRNNTPTPNDLLFGAIWDMMNTLVPKEERFTVTPISGYGKDKGNEGAVFSVKWG